MTKRRRERFERSKIIIPILLAGWIPSVLTLIVSYTILRDTLESRILRDRQTLVQLLGHVVRTDLSRSSEIINYYESLPEVARILSSPNPAPAAQQWVNSAFYSHPNVDGMFLAGPDGALLGINPHHARDWSAKTLGRITGVKKRLHRSNRSCRRYIPGSPITAL